MNKTFTLIAFLTLFSLGSLSAQCTLSCNVDVFMSIDSTIGTFEVLPDMVLSGDHSSCDDLTVILFYGATGDTIPTTPKLTIAEVGQDINFKVVENSSGNVCWGTIMLFGTPGSGPLSTETLQTEPQIDIFPNPANSQLNIAFEKQNDYQLELMNVLGRTVLETQFRGTNKVLDIQNIPQGTYFLHVLVDSKRHTRKIMVRH